MYLNNIQKSVLDKPICTNIRNMYCKSAYGNCINTLTLYRIQVHKKWIVLNGVTGTYYFSIEYNIYITDI